MLTGRLRGDLRLGVCAAALLVLGCSEGSDVTATKTDASTQTASADAKPGPDGWAGTIRGTVTSLNGDPVEGAYVKLRNDERRLTIMVISKGAGAYEADKLRPAPGKSRPSAAISKARGRSRSRSRAKARPRATAR